MKKYKSLGNSIPYPFFKYLFGNRRVFGKEIDYLDPNWIEWGRTYLEFYEKNQKQSIGKKVNNAGYNVLKKIDFIDKDVLELGPGKINHLQYWNSLPKSYALADIKKEFLDINDSQLKNKQINFTKHLIKSDVKLPFESASKDIIITFYQLEHLHPLEEYLEEYMRVLKPNGVIVGAIPCEGGMAWGLGRFLTSRRWLMANTTINPDKLICWEHPNFADFILNTLNKKGLKQHLSFWPFVIPSIDINLIAKFVFKKQ
jgi:SAM-dependent methyltransferase